MEIPFQVLLEQGIILGGLVVDTNINDNTISGVDTGIKVYEGSTSNYPTGTLVNENLITDCETYGLNWLGTELLDAENNNWGVTAYEDVLALVSGNVDFIPWLPVDETDPIITNLALDKNFAIIGDDVTITADISDDRDIARYVIDFGDGENITVEFAGEHDLIDSIDETHSYSVEGDYVITLTVTDATGNKKTETTAVVINGEEPDWVISLHEGWNLFSIPFIPENDDTSINSVLGGIIDNIAYEGSTYTIFQYDATYDDDGKWYKARRYSDPEDGFYGTDTYGIDDIVPGYAYWIKMENADVLYGNKKDFSPVDDGIPSVPEIPSIDLALGSWNLVGRYGTNPTALDILDAFELLQDYYHENFVLEFDNINNEWDIADSIDVGQGYWLRTETVPELSEISYEPGSYYFE